MIFSSGKVVISLLVAFCAVSCKAQLSCFPNYTEHPLLLISMDGFRYDYLTRNRTPTIQEFHDRGVSAPYIKPCYPSITFPNHYTIVTGLYPESHGIVGNHFYDRSTDSYFDLGDPETRNGSWWGGDPIWNTNMKQGGISATMFWPGSDADIEGMLPNYTYIYDGSMPYNDRVDQVLEWLALPEDIRPNFISLYFDEPDHTGHNCGPDSEEVDEILTTMDQVFKNLTDGIIGMGIEDCVNIILLADHGMTTAGNSTVINLATYHPEVANEGYVEYGPFGMIYVDNEEDIDPMRSDFAGQQPELRQYSPNSMPTRTHFSNNDRIGDVLLDTNLGYQNDVGEPGQPGDELFSLNGQHGYDHLYTDMQPIFIAHGPEFRTSAEIEPFQNIEIYDLMCTLLNLIPSPNNGTEGSLYHALDSPPDYPTTPIEVPPINAIIPDESTVESHLNISGCPGDYSTVPDWVETMNMTDEEIRDSHQIHMPWGIPLVGDLPIDLILLNQFDHITGYSNNIKMPLWSSFTITAHTSGTSVSPWTSDVRLDKVTTPTCQSYEGLNATMEPLFPRRYSEDNQQKDIPYLVSNAVPMTPESLLHWTEITYNYLANWFDQSVSPINVIVGPVFDNNYDSLVDNFTLFNGESPEIPSHMFMVVTRCLQNVTTLNDCPPIALDAIAFILPQRNAILNCMDTDDFALKFSAKVKDVETVTGFTFYPNLDYDDRIRLEIRIHSYLWYS